MIMPLCMPVAALGLGLTLAGAIAPSALEARHCQNEIYLLCMYLGVHALFSSTS